MKRQWAVAIILGMQPVGPLAAEEEAMAERPRLNPNARHLEDWSLLGDRTVEPPHPLDPLKYVPIARDGEVWMSFGGQGRMRWEAWRNFAFDPQQRDEFVLLRFRAHADLHVGEHLRAFVEGKSAFAPFGRDLPGGRRTLDVDELDLQQAFVDLTLPVGDEVSLRLRPGRQELIFGRQRLVSPLDWSNTRRTWEGVRADLEVAHWTVSAFGTRFVPVRKYDFNTGDSDELFYGAYATGPTPLEPVRADAYLLVRELDALDEQRYTVGGRLFGEVNLAGVDLDYDLEGAYQFGSRGDRDVDAFFVAAELGQPFPDLPARPRLFGGFDYASGDDDPAAGAVRTFDQLYPLGHAYFGYIDLVGRQNVLGLHTGLSVHPLRRLSVELTGHTFWRASTGDALYNAGGGVVRAGDLSGSRFIGAEMDLRFRHRLNPNTDALFGYSRFFPGAFIRDSGPSRDVDFFYLQLQYTF